MKAFIILSLIFILGCDENVVTSNSTEESFVTISIYSEGSVSRFCQHLYLKCGPLFSTQIPIGYRCEILVPKDTVYFQIHDSQGKFYPENNYIYNIFTDGKIITEKVDVRK